MHTRFSLTVASMAGLTCLLATTAIVSYDEGWPREADHPEARALMHQP